MTDQEIRDALDRAETAVERGEDLGGTGFWKAVGEVKASPDLVPEHGARIARIDRAAFEDWAVLLVPIRMGTALAVAALLLGLGGVAAMYYIDEPWNWVVLGLALVALFPTVHGLSHLVVGTLAGIRFTSWFVASLTRPQPGVKIDYESYLATPPRRRAWMHASGALAGKLLPVALLFAGVAADLPAWVIWALAALAVAQVVTDVVWSTKSSDWKRFRREMGYAR